MKKKLLSIIALLCLTVSSAWADLTPQSGDEWNYYSKTLTVNSNPRENAYKDQKSIEHLIIANTVTSIGKGAFEGCSGLLSVTFASDSQLETIGDNAFYGCSNTTLRSIEIPASVKSIGTEAFRDCNYLTKFEIIDTPSNPSQLTSIPNGMLIGSSITSITIPSSVTSIGSFAFYNCLRLASVYVKNGSATLGVSAFSNCPITVIYVPTDQVSTYQSASYWSVYEKWIRGTDVWGSDLWGSNSGDDADHPYVISSTAGLDLLAAKVNAGNDFEGKFFKLGADITYSYDGLSETDCNYTPIGGVINNIQGSFQGTFDGDNHTISGIRIYNMNDYQGLFGAIHSAGTVKQVILFDTKIAGKSSVGGIASYSYGTIEKCQVLSDVIIHAPIANCNSHGGITGGLGYIDGGTIKDCFSAAVLTSVEGLDYYGECGNVGGIVGMNNTNGSVENCLYIGGKIAGNSNSSGAIAGYNKYDKDNKTPNFITNCYYTDIEAKPVIGSGKSATNSGQAYFLTLKGDFNVQGIDESSKVLSFTTPAHQEKGTTVAEKSYNVCKFNRTVTLGYNQSAIPEGYDFKGFTVTKDGTDPLESVTVEKNEDKYSFLMPANHVTVAMILDPIAYGISYDLAGGSVTTANPTTYTVESNAITLVNPTRTGYTFAGWKGTGLTEATKTVTIAKGSTGTRSYTATWTLDNYAITCDLAGGSVTTANPTTYTVESNAITLVNPTRTGYTFAGWTGTGLDAATMTVTIAKGSMGAKSYTATWKKLLTNTDIKVSAIADQTYTGKALIPAVKVMDGETNITDQCDVAYSDNTNAGTATVTITAKTTSTNYTGKTTATFNIVAKTVSTPTITLSQTSYFYDGTAKEPAVSSVKVGDTVIPASEYTVAYENNTNAGTATVKIVDKDGGNYTVSGSTTFEIVLKGDANGDKKVNAADIVRLVNDNAPQSDIDAVVKIIMQNK